MREEGVDQEEIAGRLRPLPPSVERIKEKLFSISLDIHDHPEIGSEEYRSSGLLEHALQEAGLNVKTGTFGMDTSFLATTGSGEPKVAVLAEYDALPIGHACGHNIIGTWAAGVGMSLAGELQSGTLYVVGTPAEEGFGRYAASKVIIAPLLKDAGINAVFAVHPADEWAVGANLLGVVRYSYEFTGKDAHAAASPEKGANALDAAVDFYASLKKLYPLLSRRHQFVLSAVIRDGGTAPNVIPGRAEVWADIRADDPSYMDYLVERVESLAESSAALNGCRTNAKPISPKLSPYKRWDEMDAVYLEAARHYLKEVRPPESVYEDIATASSDVGNVSQLIPTSHLSIKIGAKGIAPHSPEFREAAGSQAAQEALLTAVAIGHDAVLSFMSKAKRNAV